MRHFVEWQLYRSSSIFLSLTLLHLGKNHLTIQVVFLDVATDRRANYFAYIRAF